MLFRAEKSDSSGQNTDITASFDAAVREHLRLDVEVDTSRWAERDANYAEKLAAIGGLRVLHVEILECFVSFIASSQNNIKRLSQMVERLRAAFPGNLVAVVDGRTHYRFPTLDQLCTLRTQDFEQLGYRSRSRFFPEALRYVEAQGGVAWLQGLRDVGHTAARAALQECMGVGPKVADCICLFGLCIDCAVPVDTHCWQFACRDYFPHWKPLVAYFGWRLDNKKYSAITARMHAIFGRKRTGWAFMVLFTAEVHPFRRRLDKPKAIRVRVMVGARGQGS